MNRSSHSAVKNRRSAAEVVTRRIRRWGWRRPCCNARRIASAATTDTAARSAADAPKLKDLPKPREAIPRRAVGRFVRLHRPRRRTRSGTLLTRLPKTATLQPYSALTNEPVDDADFEHRSSRVLLSSSVSPLSTPHSRYLLQPWPAVSAPSWPFSGRGWACLPRCAPLPLFRTHTPPRWRRHSAQAVAALRYPQARHRLDTGFRSPSDGIQTKNRRWTRPASSS